jgi:hypothetical protein
MVRGSCLCGGIQFEATSVERMGHCHCSMCRKAHGAAFGTFAAVPARAFRWVKGWELVQLYESSPGSHRAFCRVCGSNAPVRSADGASVLIPAGLFDTDPGVRPSLHMFVGSKAPWWEIADALPQYEEYAPGTRR